MRLSQDNFAIYIVTYNRSQALNKSIRGYLESLPFIPPITVISNHSVCQIEADLQPHVNLIYNRLRPDESWGYLGRNWNQCFQLGLRQYDWLLCSQDDVQITPGWLDLIESTSFDFYLAPLGDTRFLLNRSAFRRVGWFDEQFYGMGFHEHDYLLRVLNLIPNSATIVDLHPQQPIRHNDIGLDHYWIQPEPEGFDKIKQIGGSYVFEGNAKRLKYFRQKWGGIHPFKKVIGIHPDRMPREIDIYPFISAKYEYLRLENNQYGMPEHEWEEASKDLEAVLKMALSPYELNRIPKCKILGYLDMRSNEKVEMITAINRHLSKAFSEPQDLVGVAVLVSTEEEKNRLDQFRNDNLQIVAEKSRVWSEELVEFSDFSIDL